MSEDPAEFLQLHAMDADGLQYISACTQDAIARVADMGYQPRLNRFALVLTRFRWERAEARHENSERVRAGLHFETVTQVRTQDIDMSDANGLLPLLAISVVLTLQVYGRAPVLPVAIEREKAAATT